MTEVEIGTEIDGRVVIRTFRVGSQPPQGTPSPGGREPAPISLAAIGRVRSPSPPVAIIFDMDGVLIDSEPLWKRAEVETFGDVGIPLTEEMCLATTGMRVAETVDYWFERYPWSGPTTAEVAKAVVRRVSGLIAQEGTAMTGAIPLVRALHRQGALLGLCSSSPKSLIDAVCERLGLGECFVVRQTAEDCEHGKPFPDPYLTTARRLGVTASSCLAIEDSMTGIRSALDAGMAVVGVGTTVQAAELCDWALPNLATVDVRTLLRWQP